MSYIDGFVAPVPTSAKEAYRAYAARMAPIFREYGATAMVECWGDDVPDGQLTSFPLAVKLGPDETVVFSWTHWPDKATRDAGWAKLMTDPRMGGEMPFDGKRMIYGGFETLLEG